MRSGQRGPVAILTAGVLAVGSLLAACGDSAGETADGLTPVKVGTFPGLLQTFYPYLAQEKGMLADHNIKAEFVNFTTGPDLATALVTGSTDISDEGLSIIWPLLKDGQNIVALEGSLLVNYSLAARPDVQLEHASEAFPDNLLDLKGKRIGVSSRGSVTEAFVTELAKAAGLNPETDIKFVATGGASTAAAAFQNKQIDMQVLFPPVGEVLGEAGKDYRVVADMLDGGETTGEVMRGQLIDVWAANGRWLEENPEVAEGFCAAMAEARAYAVDPANIDTVSQALAKWTNLPPDTAKDVWQKYGDTFHPELNQDFWKSQAEFALGDAAGFVPGYAKHVHEPCAG